MIVNEQNTTAWNAENYNAWVNRFGTPEVYAQKLMKDPRMVIDNLLFEMGEVKQKKIINLMGSNGNKAVAFALLGAEVTVVDFSNSNAAYALLLASNSNVHIQYLVKDVMSNDLEMLYNQFDWVVAEMGILHYFIDLEPFFTRIKNLLCNGGSAIIKDFHPISTKLIVSRGSTAKVRKHKVEGDYFSSALVEREVAYSKFGDSEPEKVYLRLWTLGEIVTAAASAGLVVTKLLEAPNASSDVFDKGIPKTFTLIIRKQTTIEEADL